MERKLTAFVAHNGCLNYIEENKEPKMAPHGWCVEQACSCGFRGR